ncbi:magnesium transporter [Entomortierella parvispora]|uniref:Magnesium transporter n=1 Tax=Entomortierella parvispora TaxID=205924 RepID=A0A9P3LR29_9FUNG|nr:magnesium transporter [Entomortierella parvispora]
MSVTGSAFVDFVIGFAVSLVASVMNAAGLNLLKLDHVRNSALAQDRQRNECGRPMWHIGLYLYVASQLAGSTIALNFLKTQWVAPLGSIALIFNFVFAKILVGTQITRQDVYGTIVVMASVVWIVVFGGMNSGGDIEDTLTLADLKALFSRVVFIIYFSILNAIIFSFLALGMYAYWAISLDDDSGQMRKNMKTKLTQLLGKNRLARASGLTLEGDEGLEAEARDQRLKKVVAMIMSSCGGLLASETLLLAKSGVKLITSTLAGQNQFTDNLSYFILFVLVFTAILQVYCLNTALKLYDSVLVVPTFYGFYTAFGLVNSTIYLNQLGSYEPWVLLLVLLGIASLIYGVRMLSAPKPELNPSGGALSALDNGYLDDEDDDAHEMEHRSKAGSKGTKNIHGDTIKGPKKTKLSTRLKKSLNNKRQSHAGAGKTLDEENDIPSLYSSRRGMMDDESSEISSTLGGANSSSGASGVGSIAGTSTRTRGLSFASKSSFQSDPFRTPKDSRSINEDYMGGAGGQSPASAVGTRRSLPFTNSPLMVEEEIEPTHVLVDTTEELDGSDDEGHAGHQFQRQQQQQQRRESMLKDSLKNLTMHEKRASLGNQWSSQSQSHLFHQQQLQQTQPEQGQLPTRIDTTAGRSRRDSARLSNSAGAVSVEHMSPSQFRAHLTKSRPLQDESNGAGLGYEDRDGLDEVVGFSSTTASNQPLARSHSVRWSTGSSKIDQVFEDLNPFKSISGYQNNTTTSNNRESIGSVISAAATVAMAAVGSTIPASTGQATGPERPSHGRQDSFTGLPSEWDVPGRKKRHSMRFGDVVRSNSASGGLSSPSTASSAAASAETGPGSGSGSGSSSLSSSSTPSHSGMPSPALNITNTTSSAEGAIPFAFAGGVVVDERNGPSDYVTPSPRTSRIMSSPEIQLTGFNFPASLAS